MILSIKFVIEVASFEIVDFNVNTWYFECVLQHTDAMFENFE